MIDGGRVDEYPAEVLRVAAPTLLEYTWGEDFLTWAAFLATLLSRRSAMARPKEGQSTMKIKLSSLLVEDQAKALKFYTEVLRFVKKTEIPAGEYKWLTVVAAQGPQDVELVLEPVAFPPARTYQKAVFEAGIPLTAFEVDNLQTEFERLKKAGVKFRGEPAAMGPVTAVLFEDTCGNLIQLYQVQS